MSDPNPPQPSAAPPPQGWYPNADGKQQWWDGTTWGNLKPEGLPPLVVWALVLGLVGLGISLIPFVIFFGFWVAAAGGVLGIVAVVKNLRGRPQAIAAIVSAGLAIVLGSVITGAVAGTLPSSNLADSRGGHSGSSLAEQATPTATPTPTSTTPPAPAATAAETQAYLAAQGYLRSGIGFSQAGLLAQLTSSYGSGFAAADAQWAIDKITPDWNAQAVIAAKGYMASGIGFSRSSLIDQMTSPYGSQFTPDQAAYAADKVGL